MTDNIKHKWTSIADDVPNDGRRVLTHAYNQQVYISSYYHKEKRWLDINDCQPVNVGYWMDTPAEPKYYERERYICCKCQKSEE